MLVLIFNCTSGGPIGTQLVPLNHVCISPLISFWHLTLSLILGNSIYMSVHISQDLGSCGRETGDASERVQGNENLCIMALLWFRGVPKGPWLEGLDSGTEDRPVVQALHRPCPQCFVPNSGQYFSACFIYWKSSLDIVSTSSPTASSSANLSYYSSMLS